MSVTRDNTRRLLTFLLLLCTSLVMVSCNDDTEKIVDETANENLRPDVSFTRIGGRDVTNTDMVIPVSQQDTVIILTPSVAAQTGAEIEKVILVVNNANEQEVATYTVMPNTFTITIDFPSNGSYTLEAQAVDEQGERSKRVTQMVRVGSSNTGPSNPTTDLSVTWRNPSNANSTLRGNTTLRVAVDDAGIEIETVEIFIGSQGDNKIGDAVNTFENVWSLVWDTVAMSDNIYTLRAVATDKAGNTAQAVINTTVANAITLDPLEVSINPSRISPSACESQGSMLRCGGTITIPVQVDDETASTVVTLKIDSEEASLRTFKDEDPPYQFVLNTGDYNNGDILEVTARAVRGADNASAQSQTVMIEVFNEYPLPTIDITDPANGDTLEGIINVSGSIQQPADPAYTMDLNGDGDVSKDDVCGTQDNPDAYREGFLVKFIDFNGRVIASQYIDQRDKPDLGADTDNNFMTKEGFRTIDFANDTYTIRLQVVLRNQDSTAAGDCNNYPDGSFITLTEEIAVTTENTNRVPPAVLIDFPVNKPGDTNLPTYTDGQGFIIVTASDNLSIDYLEVRVFSDEGNADATPSRHICSLGDVSGITASLPISPDADPYLPDGDYTVRVIAQDSDGNRTPQEINITIDRTAGSGYDYSLVGPYVPITDDNGNITGREVRQPVNPGVSYGIEVVGNGNVADYDYIYTVTSGTSCAVGVMEGIATSQTAFADVHNDEGVYLYRTMAIDGDNRIYTGGSLGVSLKQETAEVPTP